MFGELESAQGKNRNFICSCQKAYLSYAALFTHIKQKHGGKAPGEIVRPRSLNKRGRPRKSQKPPLQRCIKSESYNGLSSNMENNNNKRFIIGSNSVSNSNNYNIVEGDNGRGGFKSFSRVGALPSGINKKPSTMSYHSEYHPDEQHISSHPPSSPPHSQQQQPIVSYSQQQQNMQFSNLNNEFSNNTLTMAAIIIGLQQTFKQAVGLELVRDDKLECFVSYGELKKYHGLKLSMKPQQRKDEDVFVLGNVICAFLNFCHQTLDSKASYQQIVLLMVCLLDHIKTLKQSHSINILTQSRKQIIHQSLPSFFEQYLQKVLVRLRMKYWVFRQNNSFKVLIWFLNWLSAIEVNYLKGICGVMGQEKREEKMGESEQNQASVQEQVQQNNGNTQHVIAQQFTYANDNPNLTAKNTNATNQTNKQQISQLHQHQQQSQLQESQNQVQFENPVFFVSHEEGNEHRPTVQSAMNNDELSSQPSSSSQSPSSSSSSSSCQQQESAAQAVALQKKPSSESQQNNNNMMQIQRLSSQVR